MVRPLLVASLVCFTLAPVSSAQGPAKQMPPDYRGVTEQVGGIFVTPMPGAPFSATVDIVSKQVLADGQEHVRTTLAHIYRDTQGRIYNERREMAARLPKDDPPLLSAHIYDPTTHLNTFLNPYTHLAHQSIFTPDPPLPGGLPNLGRHDGGQLTSETDLGQQTIDATGLHGTRKVWTVSASESGTGKVITITDEYWYSPALSIYLILKHEDPRTGEQIIAVQNVSEREPEASIFQVPARFRIVDETPAP